MKKDIEYLGILTKLELSKEDKLQALQDIDAMIDNIEILKQIDTEDIEPMSHVLKIENVFRDDEISNPQNMGDMLSNAPSSKNNMFVVPKTF